MIAVMFVLKRIKPSSIVPTKLLPLFFFTYLNETQTHVYTMLLWTQFLRGIWLAK